MFFGKARSSPLPALSRASRPGIKVRGVEAFAVAAVGAGRCVVVMLKSTITKDPLGWPMAGKTGAARMALQTGVPVLPLGQWGAQELLEPGGRFRAEPGHSES